MQSNFLRQAPLFPKLYIQYLGSLKRLRDGIDDNEIIVTADPDIIVRIIRSEECLTSVHNRWG